MAENCVFFPPNFSKVAASLRCTAAFLRFISSLIWSILLQQTCVLRFEVFTMLASHCNNLQVIDDGGDVVCCLWINETWCLSLQQLPRADSANYSDVVSGRQIRGRRTDKNRNWGYNPWAKNGRQLCPFNITWTIVHKFPLNLACNLSDECFATW